jgi:histidyl-tRNA synthetase
VLSGGRYDRLIGYYGRPAPATGFSVDIEAIALAQRALGLPPARRGVWLALSIEPSLARTAALARALRAAGARVALAPAQASWPAFLRGANLDAALVLGQERLVLAAGGEEPLDAALLAAVAQADAGHAHPLLELVTARISRT